MKIAISYPPLESSKGVPLLAQNRQFQWFCSPTYIYPVVPAYAASLLAKEGYSIIWDDAIAEEKGYGEWLRGIERSNLDLIAIETKTPVVKKHWAIIEDIKRCSPETEVVLMGDHVTALPAESLEQSKADYIITGGDYDFSLLSIAKHLSGEGELEPGIWYRKNGEIKNTGKFALKHSLNDLPAIDRELTKWWLYSENNGNYKQTPGSYIMAGRDCWWHRCTFCSWTLTFPSFRARKPELVVDEIEFLVSKYGIKEIMDDTGTFPAGNWLSSFCEAVIERGLNERVILDCNMRFGALSLEEYKLMKQAGFRLLLFGLESANQDTLNRLNKGITVEQITDSCEKAKQAGLEPHITIMFGYPWETRVDAERTLALGQRLLKKGLADTLQATLVIPYPGTKLFEECRKNGLLVTEDWNRYDQREPVMKTEMSPEEVLGYIERCYKVAFDPEFIARKIAGVRSAEDVKYLLKAGKKVIGHVKDFSGTSKEKKEDI